MNLNKITPILLAAAIMLFIAGCKTPSLTKSPSAKAMPADFSSGLDSNLNSGVLTWRQFFKDPYLAALIDTALLHNQELAIMRRMDSEVWPCWSIPRSLGFMVGSCWTVIRPRTNSALRALLKSGSAPNFDRVSRAIANAVGSLE